MAYMKNLNEPLPGEPIVLAALSARTANGSGPALSVGERSTVRLDLACTAASGTTPSCTVTLEHSPDGSSWSTHTAFTAFTGATTQRKVMSGLDRYVRVSWTITGTTPSLTFSVTGEMV